MGIRKYVFYYAALFLLEAANASATADCPKGCGAPPTPTPTPTPTTAVFDFSKAAQEFEKGIKPFASELINTYYLLVGLATEDQMIYDPDGIKNHSGVGVRDLFFSSQKTPPDFFDSTSSTVLSVTASDRVNNYSPQGPYTVDLEETKTEKGICFSIYAYFYDYLERRFVLSSDHYHTWECRKVGKTADKLLCKIRGPWAKKTGASDDVRYYAYKRIQNP